MHSKSSHAWTRGPLQSQAPASIVRRFCLSLLALERCLICSCLLFSLSFMLFRPRYHCCCLLLPLPLLLLLRLLWSSSVGVVATPARNSIFLVQQVSCLRRKRCDYNVLHFYGRRLAAGELRVLYGEHKCISHGFGRHLFSFRC